MKQCSWCQAYFSADVSYQIYCGEDCRTAATRKKSKERARIATIKRRQKKTRVCKNKGCGTVLSLYNDNNVCSKCEISEKQVKDALKAFKDFFNE